MGNLSSQQGDKKGRRGRAMAPRPVLNSGSEKAENPNRKARSRFNPNWTLHLQDPDPMSSSNPLRVLEVPCPALFTWTLTVTYRHPMRQERMTQLWKGIPRC
ncbi:hypothetical protein CEXT_414501 [Caerostris extrusa]|uniref:Uncharacterized protein n=1 Tax=Caerostris extrusa TaxID=172846 RepID=A0AAV4U7B7_CAEEX|nr:hypothetical protein CEXT_414501 [Caerostris extrusa]